MSDRWWAPQRPTLDPDAAVLAMLEPGDLGSSLLAAHRAGAAALETVAAAPVPSEMGVAAAMATARERFAPAVVRSVAKKLDPAYAGLLVRDVLDDAELAVVHLYRTAVNKGVSPPLAVQRAAAVYGVPSRSLGTYAVLAVDPRANPVAVTDAADRALLGHVSKMVETETQPVSKAWDERKHRRDSEGQFAPKNGAYATAPDQQTPKKTGSLAWLREQLGLAGAAPKEVAGVTEPKEEARETKALPQRQMRNVRAVRQTRKIRTLTPTGQTKTGTAERTLTRTLTASDLTKLARTQGERQAALRTLNATVDLEHRISDKPSAPIPDLLKVDPGAPDVQYYDLSQPVAIVLSADDSARFRKKMRDQAGQTAYPESNLFRMGHLTDLGTAPEDSTKSGHSVAIASAAEMEYRRLEEEAAEGMPEFVEPDVYIITPEDVRASGLSAPAMLQMAKADVAQRSPNSDPHTEINHIAALELYRQYGRYEFDDSGNIVEDPGSAIVHFHAGDSESPNARPRPIIDEYIVVSDARGAEDEYGRHRQLVLDPNQAYQLTNAPTDKPGTRIRPQQFWDAENGVIVNRYFIKPVDESVVDDHLRGVEKAEGAYERRQRRALTNPELRSALGLPVWDESKVKRDEQGRFSEVELRRSTVAPGSQRIRGVRQVRQTRHLQSSTPTRALTRVDARHRQMERQLQRSPMARALARQLMSNIEQDPRLPALSDSSRFKVMSEQEFGHLAGELFDETVAEVMRGSEVRLSSYERGLILEQVLHDETRVLEVADKMAQLVDADPTLRAKQTRTLKRYAADKLPAYEDFAAELDKMFDDDPTLAKLEIVRQGREVVVFGNREQAHDQVLIEVDGDLDYDQPLYMNYLGSYQARSLSISNAERELSPLIHPTGDNEGVVANPEVHVYRVTTKRMRIRQ